MQPSSSTSEAHVNCLMTASFWFYCNQWKMNEEVWCSMRCDVCGPDWPKCLPFQNTATFFHWIQSNLTHTWESVTVKKLDTPIYMGSRVLDSIAMFAQQRPHNGELTAFAWWTLSVHSWHCWFWALAQTRLQWILLCLTLWGHFAQATLICETMKASMRSVCLRNVSNQTLHVSDSLWDVW